MLVLCTSGFPHSEITGSKLDGSSPVLIAALHVLLRCVVPRHPLNAYVFTHFIPFSFKDTYLKTELDVFTLPIQLLKSPTLRVELRIYANSLFIKTLLFVIIRMLDEDNVSQTLHANLCE